MIAIGLLFIRLLCDLFKPRQQPRSWCCGINSMACSSVRHGDHICGGWTALCSSGFIGAALAFSMP
jgi:hypothetical protein